jgi:outer membrane immunogenic protein
MQKLFLGTALSLAIAGSAAAADLPVYSKAPPPPPWSWTGFYVGIQGGAGWGTVDPSLNTLTFCEFGCTTISGLGNSFSSSYGLNGWHGGGTAGFNLQSGRFVFGVEGDISGANIHGAGACGLGLFVGGLGSSCQTKMPWFATATGRLGFTFDRTLVYVKGGAAFATFNHEQDTAVFFGPPTTAVLTNSISDNRVGATAGIGIEYAFMGPWSAKLEYDYMDFGTKNLNFAASGTLLGIVPVSIANNLAVTEQVHVVRGGINFRF